MCSSEIKNIAAPIFFLYTTRIYIDLFTIYLKKKKERNKTESRVTTHNTFNNVLCDKIMLINSKTELLPLQIYFRKIIAVILGKEANKIYIL